MKLIDLDSLAIMGPNQLGGSSGLAINRSLSHVPRLGYSHRSIIRHKIIQTGTIDF
ncbi:MAG: hypothetical protein JW860_15795 [Sedimentisphaerales bacterium]|nr:hypothetical protein [Sedimentisphaerales bacterium]